MSDNWDRLTTEEAATLCDMDERAFTRAMARARGAGVDLRLPMVAWPDQRSTLWNLAGVLAWRDGLLQ